MRKHMNKEEKMQMIESRMDHIENNNLREAVYALMNMANLGQLPVEAAHDAITSLLRVSGVHIYRVSWTPPIPADVENTIAHVVQAVADAFKPLYHTDSNAYLPLWFPKRKLGSIRDFDDAHDRKWAVVDAFIKHQVMKVQNLLEKAYKDGRWNGKTDCLELARERLGNMEGDFFNE